MLKPVNVIASYLGRGTMWKTWSWQATEGINEKVRPWLKELDPTLPTDSRLALPVSAAAFFLYRALRLKPTAPLPAALYDEIADGLRLLDRLHETALAEVRQTEFARHFAGAVDVAEKLLQHAQTVGLDAFRDRLILQCALGDRCLRAETFYVTPPPRGGRATSATDYHAACRQAAHRVSQRRRSKRKIKRPKRR